MSLAVRKVWVVVWGPLALKYEDNLCVTRSHLYVRSLPQGRSRHSKHIQKLESKRLRQVSHMPACNRRHLLLPDVVLKIQDKPTSRSKNSVDFRPGCLMEIPVLRAPLHLTTVIRRQGSPKSVSVRVADAAVLRFMVVGKPVAVCGRGANSVKVAIIERQIKSIP